jgi:hypothetical protein
VQYRQMVSKSSVNAVVPDLYEQYDRRRQSIVRLDCLD